MTPAPSPELVTRLRRIARGYEGDDYGIAVNLDDAAAEIDRLTEEVARLREALKEILDCLQDGDENGAYRTARYALPKEPA